KSRQPIPLTVVDKENGGRADALNAAINAARYPYVLATDADVIIAGAALVHAMRLVSEDRKRVVCVGGNVRPINGCRLAYGNVVAPRVPVRIIARCQPSACVRSFEASG